MEEVDVRPAGGKDSQDDPTKPDAWEREISRFGKGGAYVYSDGSLLDRGNVGGGALVGKSDGAEEEVECGIGDIATVWDGGVAGMAGA